MILIITTLVVIGFPLQVGHRWQDRLLAEAREFGWSIEMVDLLGCGGTDCARRFDDDDDLM